MLSLSFSSSCPPFSTCYLAGKTLEPFVLRIVTIGEDEIEVTITGSCRAALRPVTYFDFSDFAQTDLTVSQSIGDTRQKFRLPRLPFRLLFAGRVIDF